MKRKILFTLGLTACALWAQAAEVETAFRANHERSVGYGWNYTGKFRALPRVLFIDERDAMNCAPSYYGTVQEVLKEKFNLMAWGSTVCLTRPTYRAQLAAYLNDFDYAVVHVAPARPADGMDTAVWRAALEAVFADIRAKQPKAKIVWTTFPASRAADEARVGALNAAGRAAAAAVGATVDDRYALLKTAADSALPALKRMAEQSAALCLKLAPTTVPAAVKDVGATGAKTTGAALEAGGGQPVSANIAGREGTEWSIGNGWHFTDGDRALPRALFVGDSITFQYGDKVRDELKGRMNVTVWASSYCLTRPIFRELLASYLADAEYAVVHLNSGGHSFQTPTAAWKKALEDIVCEIRAKQPKAKIVWTTYTPVRSKSSTARIREFNAAADEVVRALKLDAVDDHFGLVTALKDPWKDGVHLKGDVQKLQAKQAAEICLGLLR